MTPSSTPQQIVNVPRGLVSGHSVISKFGENAAIQPATPAILWDYGPTEEDYIFPTTATIDSISSSSGSDTVDIEVQGLDADWREVIQTITLTGQTRAALTSPLIRVYRALNVNGTDLVGNVYIYENTTISGGIPTDTTKVKAYIAIADQQTLMGIYTIPAGKNGYFLGLSASISKQPTAGNAVFTGQARLFGGVFTTKIRFNLSSTGTSHINIPGTAASPFPEKTDFIAKADVTANGTGVSVTFDLLLIDN